MSPDVAYLRSASSGTDNTQVSRSTKWAPFQCVRRGRPSHQKSAHWQNRPYHSAPTHHHHDNEAHATRAASSVAFANPSSSHMYVLCLSLYNIYLSCHHHQLCCRKFICGDTTSRERLQQHFVVSSTTTRERERGREGEEASFQDIT